MSWLDEHQAEFEHHEAALSRLAEQTQGLSASGEIELLRAVLGRLIPALEAVGQLPPETHEQIYVLLKQLRRLLGRDNLVSDLRAAADEVKELLSQAADTAEIVSEAIEPTVRQ